MPYDPSMHRALTLTVDEHAPSGYIIARADGPAGVWYAASRSSRAAMGDAAASAAYGDPIGTADITAEGALSFTRALERADARRAAYTARQLGEAGAWLAHRGVPLRERCSDARIVSAADAHYPGGMAAIAKQVGR